MSNPSILTLVYEIAGIRVNNSIEGGNEINAILLKAIKAILSIEPANNNNPEVTVNDLMIGHRENKINAIKAYRVRTGLGLLEAKEAIEGAAFKIGMTFGSSPFSTYV